MHRKLFSICLVVGLAMLPLSAAAAENPIDALRTQLEAGFREQTGLGFRAFECDTTPDHGPPLELSCDMVDEESDRFLYRIWYGRNDEQGQMSLWQPVDQLDADGLAWLRSPVDQFVAAFSKQQWDALQQTYLPALAQVLTPSVGAVLSSLREGAGSITDYELLLYNSVAPGVHTLEAGLAGSEDRLVARFKLQSDEDGQARLSAFSVLPAPGTRLAAKVLADVAMQTLGSATGDKVVGLNFPLQELRRTGDVAEGEAILDDGTSIAIRGEQKSPSWDFDNNDYAFQVLEASWIIDDYLEGTGVTGASVSCPARTVPDGGRLTCIASGSDGSETSYELMRRGGEHRLLPPK
jgi:hypothetical protein